MQSRKREQQNLHRRICRGQITAAELYELPGAHAEIARLIAASHEAVATMRPDLWTPITQKTASQVAGRFLGIFAVIEPHWRGPITQAGGLVARNLAEFLCITNRAGSAAHDRLEDFRAKVALLEGRFKETRASSGRRRSHGRRVEALAGRIRDFRSEMVAFPEFREAYLEMLGTMHRPFPVLQKAAA